MFADADLSFWSKQYGATAIFDDEASNRNAIRYTDDDIDKLLSRVADPATSPTKDASSSFAHAKIWEAKRDALVDVNALDEEPENLHGFWAKILAEQEEVEKEQRAAVEAQAGRGGRRKAKVVSYILLLS